MILRVWGFPICVVVTIVSAVVVGPGSLVMAPLLAWTFVLYVQCTREAIRNRASGKP